MYQKTNNESRQGMKWHPIDPLTMVLLSMLSTITRDEREKCVEMAFANREQNLDSNYEKSKRGIKKMGHNSNLLHINLTRIGPTYSW